MASILIYFLFAYLLTGIIVGGWISFFVAHKLDNDMAGASWKMKLILVPGIAAFWPVLLKKYLKVKKNP